MKSISALSEARGARWVLAYATVDVPLQEALAAPGAPLTFGATSFQGVFTPKGFRRGFHGLAATEEDGVRAAARLVRTDGAGARAATREAVKSLLAELGGRARAILVHATPGFEERVLEGLAEVDAAAGVPVFGGSAADDDLSGKWSVFLGREVVSEGVLLVAFASDRDVKGAFVSGYFGTKRSGRVTRAEGRTVYAIDDRPAAEVLDEWMGGALAAARAEGGIVLAETTLSPVGRVVDRTHGVTRYLLSHPHLVNASDGAVSFFTDMSNGDEVELMMATRGSLMDRVDHVVRRARRGAKTALAGGVLIYCGGCVGAIEESTDEVSARFGAGIGGAPFVGAATFGEIGTFESGRTREPMHGNLMCDTILFDG